MMKINLLAIIISIFPSVANARCAFCVIEVMSGASIAVLVILSVFIILFFANWGLKKFLNKAN